VPPDLEGRLSALVEVGRSSWPDQRIDDEVFVGHVAERLPAEAEAEVERALDHLHVADLHVACAAALGVPGAVEAIEDGYLSAVAGAVRTVDGSPGFVDEVCQVLRDRLFLPGASGAAPRIASYTGRHPLPNWLSMAARRTALNLRRGEAAHARAGAAALAQALPAPGEDPELDYLRTRYQTEFRDALKAAIAALTERERLLLRLHIVEGMTHDRIAPMYRVHQGTITRWIGGARESLAAAAERLLRERLSLSASEFHSLAKLVDTQMHLSLARLLQEG
jgi:RNA polymerase sigma-70 factor (ECF subfamily)